MAPLDPNRVFHHFDAVIGLFPEGQQRSVEDWIFLLPLVTKHVVYHLAKLGWLYFLKNGVLGFPLDHSRKSFCLQELNKT